MRYDLVIGEILLPYIPMSGVIFSASATFIHSAFIRYNFVNAYIFVTLLVWNGRDREAVNAHVWGLGD